MKLRAPACAVLSTVLLAGGCQRAALTVSVDIYKEDVKGRGPLKDEEVVEVGESTKRAAAALDKALDARLAASRTARTAITEYYDVAAELAAAQHLSIPSQVFEASKQNVTEVLDKHDRWCKGTQAQVTKIANECETLVQRIVLDKELKGERGLTISEAAVYRSCFVDELLGWAESLRSLAQSLANNPDAMGTFDGLVKTLLSERQGPQVKAAVANGNKRLAEQLDKGLKAFEEMGILTEGALRTARALRDKSNAIAAPTIVAGAIEADAAVNALDMALNNREQLVDRTQDATDPAWREIAAPENAYKWCCAFADTEFRAEGNSSVIIAQDRVGHFRIQRGTNNPATLIQSQMQISRTIASGVTDILSNVVGTPGLGAVLSKKINQPQGTPPAGNAAVSPTTASSTAASIGVEKARQAVLESQVSRERLKTELDIRISALDKPGADSPGAVASQEIGDLEKTVDAFVTNVGERFAASSEHDLSAAYKKIVDLIDAQLNTTSLGEAERARLSDVRNYVNGKLAGVAGTAAAAEQGGKDKDKALQDGIKSIQDAIAKLQGVLKGNDFKASSAQLTDLATFPPDLKTAIESGVEVKKNGAVEMATSDAAEFAKSLIDKAGATEPEKKSLTALRDSILKLKPKDTDLAKTRKDVDARNAELKKKVQGLKSQASADATGAAILSTIDLLDGYAKSFEKP